MYRRKVSLIIPVYNTEEHLEKCLTSAVLQTYENMEIICVDDGSTDDSGRLVDEFAKQDKRVIGIHQKKQRGKQCQKYWLKNCKRGLHRVYGL